MQRSRRAARLPLARRLTIIAATPAAPPVHWRVRRGCSSVGRARQSHCRGQGFDSPQLHRVLSLRRPFRRHGGLPRQVPVTPAGRCRALPRLSQIRPVRPGRWSGRRRACDVGGADGCSDQLPGASTVTKPGPAGTSMSPVNGPGLVDQLLRHPTRSRRRTTIGPLRRRRRSLPTAQRRRRRRRRRSRRTRLSAASKVRALLRCSTVRVQSPSAVMAKPEIVPPSPTR